MHFDAVLDTTDPSVAKPSQAKSAATRASFGHNEHLKFHQKRQRAIGANPLKRELVPPPWFGQLHCPELAGGRGWARTGLGWVELGQTGWHRA